MNEKPLMHVHLHSFKESNIEGDFLLVMLNEPKRGKGGKRPRKHPEMDKFSKAWDEKVNQNGVVKSSKEFLALFDTFQTLMV